MSILTNNIQIQTDTDILENPYTFEYQWENVKNVLIDFSKSYLDLTIMTTPDVDPSQYTVNATLPGSTTNAKLTYEQLVFNYLDQLKQDASIYSIIDSVDIFMKYGLPDGTERVVKFNESGLNSSRARKMIALKTMSKNDLEKSLYVEDLSAIKDNITSLRNFRAHPNTEMHISIPLYLISGLGMNDSTLVDVKELKMIFHTNTLTSILNNSTIIDFYLNDNGFSTWYSLTNSSWFTSFKLRKATMNLMTYPKIDNKSNELINFVPSYVQINYKNNILDQNYFDLKCSIPFMPEYIIYWFSNGYNEKLVSNIASSNIWPTYLRCEVANMVVYPQTELPSQIIPQLFTQNNQDMNSTDTYNTYCPNKSLYSTWVENTNPNNLLSYEKWIQHPVYIIPCKSAMNVSTFGDIDIDIHCILDVHNKERININNYTKQDGLVLKTEGSSIDSNTYYNDIVTKDLHAGYFYVPNNNILKTNPYTFHMVAVRTVKNL